MNGICETEFIPILVEPLYQGNIGSVARLARNFGMKEMIMVNPPELEDEAIAYSMHGKSILLGARRADSLFEALNDMDFAIGTSGISDSGEKCYQRNPMTTDEMKRWIRTATGKIGIVLGREDKGLLKEELEICDILVTIPADPDYPILNLSHAAGILFYEIWNASNQAARRNSPVMNNIQKNALLDHYDRLMDISRVPEHKRVIARVNFRRMMARAQPSEREFNSLMGTFSRAMDYKRNRHRKKDD
jgi:TrmH family RNA methyltransferase